jgi:phosphatidate cytidylyltransferase
MSGDSSSGGTPGGEPHDSHASRGEFKAQFEKQFVDARSQFEATSERIQARTGRNLIFAIGIGLVLGAVLLTSLIFVKALFMIVGALAIGFAALELATALRTAGGRSIPRIPTIAAALAVVPAAYYWGADGRWFVILGGVAFVLLWRLIENLAPSRRTSGGDLLRDLVTSAMIQVYVTALGSFAILLVAQNDGQWWVLAFIIAVVGTDVGAYASGLLFGKHPMAPTISPKKTWEGFAGAALVAVVAGVVLALFMIHEPWWFGVIFGLVLLGTATLGDLAESLIKRDIGIKDMSSWLPGHGGFLDRLDSILPSAAAAYALFLIVH